MDNYVSTFLPVDKNHRWLGRYPVEMTKKEFSKFNCDNRKVAFARVMPKYLGLQKVLVYRRCVHVLYTSMRRMMIKMPHCDAALVKSFVAFYKPVIDDLVDRFGHHIKYDYPPFYNHLTHFQQTRIDKLDEFSDLTLTDFELMTKIEIQIIEKLGDRPKTRAVSMASEAEKKSTGALAFALENFCKKYLKGFASGLSFQDKEQFLNIATTKGLTTRMAADFKGWDLGVKQGNDAFTYFIKKLIDFGIIKDDDVDLIVKHWCSRYHRVKVNHRNKDGTLTKLGSLILLDEMFSGSMITLLKNTFNNIFLHMFVIETYIKPSEYMLKCSGDDSECFFPQGTDKDLIKQSFLKIGTFDLGKDGGLGLLFKFLNVTDISAYNFCQTEAFYCQVCGWKIIRILKNVIIKMMYSRKILQLNREQQVIYMTALYDSVMSWGYGLPIIMEHASHFNYNSRNYTKMKVGIKKKSMPVLADYDYLTVHDPPVFAMLKEYDKDFYYSNRGRGSKKKPCCVAAYMQMLLERYNLNEQDVKQVCYDILHPVDDRINSPLLADAFKYRDNYQFL